jgi:alkanesulfonate monooxygenase SsuD/methylene tetrahydromethanopterin reductase-like flavin-dependent oxidoreductase (luciferase family)
MIRHFSTLYAGHVDLGDMGQDATPANDRRYGNAHLASVFEKTEALARAADDLGYYALWLAEHHFQHEGYECLPNILMQSVHLAHVTRRLRFGCGFNITPMWHPLRLAEDFAMADIFTGGRVIFGVGRGYHTREVETFGAPMLDGEANRLLFEEQVEIVLRAFREESFAHRGRHYTLPPTVPYRGYELRELTLVPRPLRQPVDCWQPIVSASRRGLDFMVRHGIKGIIGGGAATMAEGPIAGYRDAAARAGRDLALGQDLCLGLYFHLADTRDKALRECTPWFEEHVKMFAPLGFVPGITEDQIRAVAKRGDWTAAGVPTLEEFTRTGAWYAGPPEGLVAHLKDLEQRYPGLEYVNVSSSMGTPKAVMLEQLAWFAREVMPHFPAVKAGAQAGS